MSASKPNYTEAFTAFCNGASYEEISQTFCIPIEALRSRARSEAWASLRGRLEKAPADQPPQSENQLVLRQQARLELIERNREQLRSMADKMKQHAATVVDSLLNGRLRVRKIVSSKMGPIEHEYEPNPSDLADVAGYLKQVAEFSYRCLGDATPIAEQAGKGGSGAPQAPANIVLVLPGAVSAPRQARGVVEATEGVVVDVEAITKPQEA